MKAEKFKTLMLSLYSNNQLFIPQGHNINEWIDNTYIKEQSEWVSVEDRLPEYAEIVMLFSKDYYNFPFFGSRVINGFVDVDFTNDIIVDEITHWQPLPQLPKDKLTK